MNTPLRGTGPPPVSKTSRSCKIDLSFEEIKIISKQKYQKLLKSAISIKALEYLLDKQGRKGSEIKYSHLEMAEYLLPNNELLSIEDKRNLFEMRNHMVNIPANFASSKVITKLHL